MRFKRENCSCVFLTFWKSSIHSVIPLSFLSCLNEIPARPQLRKNALNKDILTAWALLTVKNTLFFGVLCGRGGLPSSHVHAEPEPP